MSGLVKYFSKKIRKKEKFTAWGLFCLCMRWIAYPRYLTGPITHISFWRQVSEKTLYGVQGQERDIPCGRILQRYYVFDWVCHLHIEI